MEKYQYSDPMTDASDLISFSEAAEDKQCSRTTLYKAADDGRLNDLEVGRRRMLVRDEKYEQFEPEWTGARAAQAKEDSDDSE